MNRKNTIALLLILLAIAGSVAELAGWLLPTISWPFTVSREMQILSLPAEVAPWLSPEARFHWFGWLFMLLAVVVGLYLLLRRKESLRVAPVIAKRWLRFRSFRRGYWSLLILGGIVALAAMDQCLVGKLRGVVACQKRPYCLVLCGLCPKVCAYACKVLIYSPCQIHNKVIKVFFDC